MEKNDQSIIYQTEDGQTKVDVSIHDETVWLTQEQMAELFQRDKSTISRHIRNIFIDGELDEKVVVAEFATTNQHGAIEGKTQNNITKFYNLDMIISVGYRVKSQRGVQFRIWATGIIKEYMIKGFALDDERLKGNGGGNYWKELLDRIRDIRSSEKVLYRQVLDLYATSVDYDPHSSESIKFFKIVQNKLHFAVHGHTAAEVIFERADAGKPFMGLTSFSGEIPALKDIGVAKNYVTMPKTVKSNRTVKIPEFLCHEVQEYIEMMYGLRKGERIFQFTKSYLHHQMIRGSKLAGVKRIRIHDLRHSHISLLIEMGFTPVDIAKRVGHGNINITMHYAHMFPQKQNEMIDKLEDKNNLLEEEISWTDTKKKKELTEATESEIK